MSKGHERAHASHERTAQPVRTAITQRILLAVGLILTGFAVFKAYRHQLLVDGVLWFCAIGAFAALLAGVQKKQEPGLGVKIKDSWRSIRHHPKGLDQATVAVPAGVGQPATSSPEQRPYAAQPPSPQDRSSGDSSGPPAVVPAILPPSRSSGSASLGEPPVFDARSVSGQAPWHLPVGAAPGGLAADAARLGDLEVRAASMVGAGHRCEEPAYPRQDAYALKRTPDGRYLVVAVADGVSQSPHSDLGARVAVSAAARELSGMLDRSGMEGIDVGRLYKMVAGEMLGTGRDRGLPDEDICSILITAVIPATPRQDGTRRLWTSWIGDASLWAQHEGRLHRLTGEDKSGLDRNSLSAVLPFNPDMVEQRAFKLMPYDAVAVMTDGLSDSLTSVPGVADFFAAQWGSPPPHPAAFLHSLCYDAPGQDDDRTAVVIWCGADALPSGRAGKGRRS